jgi:hypothetical protein
MQESETWHEESRVGAGTATHVSGGANGPTISGDGVVALVVVGLVVTSPPVDVVVLMTSLVVTAVDASVVVDVAPEHSSMYTPAPGHDWKLAGIQLNFNQHWLPGGDNTKQLHLVFRSHSD